VSTAQHHALTVTLQGALLVGGAGQRSNVLLCLRGSDGAPYIPASALKGAIREQLVRIGGGAQADAILGCAPGGAAPRRRDGGTTRVFIGDARLVSASDAGRDFRVRSSVSIDRRTGRAADERLFSREVFDPLEPAVFQADVDVSLLDGAQQAWFRAAVQAVFAIGAGRSVGLGAIELALVEAPVPARSELAWDAAGDDLVLWLEALEPLCLGVSRSGAGGGNFRPTLDFIPASTLRGALVAAAMARRGLAQVDQSGDALFRRLLLEPKTCLRISDAAPVALVGVALPTRAPFSLRSCKAEPGQHGHGDTLVETWLVDALARQGRYVLAADTCGVEGCGERRVRAGDWVSAAEVRKRVMTRVALDARTGRGEDGQLFSLETVEAGTRFAARVRNVDADGHDLLKDAACQGLRVGRGRGQGYGRVRIEALTRFEDAVPLHQRVADLDVELRGLERCLGADPPAGGYVVATLQTDLCPPPSIPSGATAEGVFRDALRLDGARALCGSVRAGQRGGYDTRASAESDADTPKAFAAVVRAGSSLLLALPRGLDADVVQRLEDLERRGLGERREEGYGSVRFSDPLHRPGWRRP
jgi:CRISPR-associated protein Csx10